MDTHLIPVDAVALSKITRSSPRTVVGAGSRYALGFRHDQGDLVRLQLVVVDREEPTSGVQVLKQANVYHHRLYDRSFDQHVLIRPIVAVGSLLGRRRFHETDRLRAGVAFQPVIDPAALHELHEIVLRDTRRDVPPAVDGEVRAPGQSEVQPDEGGLFVPKLGVPKMVRRNHGRMGHVVRLQLQHRRPLLR